MIYPDKYRGVSLTSTSADLTETALKAAFIGKSAYFKTRWAMVRSDGGDTGLGASTAIVALTLAPPTTAGQTTSSSPAYDASAHREPAMDGAPLDGGDLFRTIVDLTLLAGPEDVAVVEDRECDTGVPSQLIATALAGGGGKRGVIVHGRYEHVSFVVEPMPLQIRVTEVSPPSPAKLADQAARLLAVREDLPPITLTTDVIDLEDLAAAHPCDHYLLPCRGGLFAPDGALVSYLDEHPERAEWTLLGCERSQQIHTQFYGSRADRQVDICPRKRPSDGALTLTKCCLQDAELVVQGRTASVPWGSSLELVGAALLALANVARAEHGAELADEALADATPAVQKAGGH